MDTTSSFPVSAGTVLSLSCNDGYELKGDTKVTCTEDTEFQFSEKPICGKLNRKSPQILFSIMFMPSI